MLNDFLSQIPSKGSVYHKECFKCFLCHRVLDSRIANDGPDSKIYCNGEGVQKNGRILIFYARPHCMCTGVAK